MPRSSSGTWTRGKKGVRSYGVLVRRRVAEGMDGKVRAEEFEMVVLSLFRVEGLRWKRLGIEVESEDRALLIRDRRCGLEDRAEVDVVASDEPASERSERKLKGLNR